MLPPMERARSGAQPRPRAPARRAGRRGCRGAWLVALGVAVAVAAAGLAAEAHQFAHPKVLRLGVRADRLLLQVTFDLDPGAPSRTVREVFDRDADGRLDGGEQAKAERFLVESAMLFLKLDVGGAPATLTPLEVIPSNLDRPVGATETVGIAAVFEAPLPRPAPGGRVRLVLSDRDKDRAKHVPLVVDLAAGWSVAFASQGELHPGPRRIERVLLAEGAPLVLDLERRRDVP